MMRRRRRRRRKRRLILRRSRRIRCWLKGRFGGTLSPYPLSLQGEGVFLSWGLRPQRPPGGRRHVAGAGNRNPLSTSRRGGGAEKNRTLFLDVLGEDGELALEVY